MPKSLLAELEEAVAPKGKKEKEEIEVPKAYLTTKTKEERFKELKAVNNTLAAQYKEKHLLVKLGDRVGEPVPSIPTKILTFDNDVAGCGGIPRGRIIEVFGPESAGKTTICLHIVAMEQSLGNLVAFVDAEHALDPTYANLLGVNVDELTVSQPDFGEQALEIVEALLDSRAVSLVVVDSAAALVPKAEIDGEMGDSHMGLQARLMSQAMRKLSGKANKAGVTLLFTNQIREKIGVMYGSPETTPGGRALKFYSSLRLDIRRQQAIKSGDVVIGHPIKIKAVKNKMAAPFRETVIDLIYGKGIDVEKDTIQYAVNMGVIERSGAWYSFQGERVGQGMDNATETLKSSPELMAKVLAELDKARKVC